MRRLQALDGDSQDQKMMTAMQICQTIEVVQMQDFVVDRRRLLRRDILEVLRVLNRYLGGGFGGGFGC